jgi:hypothetical protein
VSPDAGERPEEVAGTILDRANAAGVPVKLVGGLGCWFLIREHAAAGRYRRSYGDVDIIVPRRSRSALAAVLGPPQFLPNTGFNAVQGQTRLMYASAGGCKVDVFVGEFEMSHRVPFSEASFAGPASAAPSAELLLTKLQLYALTAKDVSDVTGVLAFLAPGSGIDIARFAAPLGADWGIWRTVTRNLETVTDAAAEHAGEHRDRVRAAAAGLLAAANSVPKSLRWKTRSRIGERVPWYQQPEEPETEPTLVR